MSNRNKKLERSVMVALAIILGISLILPYVIGSF